MYEHLYNFHDVVLIMTAALAALLASPMLMQRNKLPQDIVLAFFVSAQGLLALYYLLLYSEFYRPTTMGLFMPFQAVPIAFFFGVQGLLLFWFSKLMSGQEMRFQRNEFVALGAVLAIPILNRLNVPTAVDLGPKHDGIFSTFPALVVSVYFGTRAILIVLGHQRQIKEQYSNLEHVNLVWLGYIAMGFVGVWLIRLAHYFLGMWGYHGLEQSMAIASNFPPLILIAAMVILSLSQSRMQPTSQKHSAARSLERTDSNGQAGEVVNEPPEKQVDPELLARLENLMVNVRVFEDPDLDREGLADSLGISPRSLSSCINGHFGLNFYEYVNAYRIDAAKEALLDPAGAEHSIQRIFEDAGFNSKSTFNTLFKKATGMTPSDFRRSGVEVVHVG